MASFKRGAREPEPVLSRIMDVHGENASAELEIGEVMDNIEWLRVRYSEVLGREASLLEYMVKVLADFDLRIRALEGKSEEG